MQSQLPRRPVGPDETHVVEEIYAPITLQAKNIVTYAYANAKQRNELFIKHFKDPWKQLLDQFDIKDKAKARTYKALASSLQSLKLYSDNIEKALAPMKTEIYEDQALNTPRWHPETVIDPVLNVLRTEFDVEERAKALRKDLDAMEPDVIARGLISAKDFNRKLVAAKLYKPTVQ